MSVENVGKGEWKVVGSEDRLDALEQVLNFVEGDDVDRVIQRGSAVKVGDGYVVSTNFT